MAYQDYLETVQRLYIAYYKRPADPVGLVYWAKALDWAGTDKNKFYAVIDSFANSAESQALYGGLSTSDVINAIYNAAFGRNAEPEGLTYWTNAITQGWTTIGRVLWEIVKPGSPSANDAIILSNKLQTAMNFTRAIDPDFDGLNLLANYSGTADAQAARDFLSGVTNNPSTVKDLSACREFIISKIADAGDAIKGDVSGQVFVLTPAIDVREGTNFDDVFIGDYVGGGALQTVQAGDTLNGLGGTDTLRLYGFTGVTGNKVIIPAITSIETIEYVGGVPDAAPTTGAAATIDLTGKTDVQTLRFKNIVPLGNNASVLLLPNQTLELENIKVKAASSKTITVDVSGAKTADVVVNNIHEKVTNNNTAVTNLYINAATNLTTLNITATGAPSDFTVTGLGAGEKLNIKGDKDVIVTFDANPNLIRINATENTGTVTLRLDNKDYTPGSDGHLKGVDNIVIVSTFATRSLDLTSQTEGFTITGSVANDTIKLGTGVNTVNAGKGNDQIWTQGTGNTLTGGLDNDQFVFTFNNFSTADKITDFVSAGSQDDNIYLDLNTNFVGTMRVTTTMLTINVRVLKATGNTAKIKINAGFPGAMLTANQLFSKANLAALTAQILAQANAAAGAMNDFAIAFGRTTANDKLYIVFLSDTNIGANAGAFVAKIVTVATVVGGFASGDIFIF